MIMEIDMNGIQNVVNNRERIDLQEAVLEKCNQNFLELSYAAHSIVSMQFM